MQDSMLLSAALSCHDFAPFMVDVKCCAPRQPQPGAGSPVLPLCQVLAHLSAGALHPCWVPCLSTMMACQAAAGVPGHLCHSNRKTSCMVLQAYVEPCDLQPQHELVSATNPCSSSLTSPFALCS